MLNPVFQNPWVRALGLLGALLLLCFVMYALSAVLIPLLSAFLVAYILDPVVDWFERRKISRSRAIGLLVALAVVLLLLVPVYIVPSAITQADQLLSGLVQKARETDDAGQSRLDAYVDRVVDALPLDRLVTIIGWRDPQTQQEVPAEDIILDRLAQIAEENRTKFQQAISQNLSGLGGGVAAMFTTVLSSVGSLGQSLLGIVLFFANFAVFAFVAGYLLRDFDGVVAAMRDLVPPKFRSKTFSIMGQIDEQVRSFLRGQITVCMCMAVMYAIGFAISGVPFWVVIAIWGGFASFIPFIGATLTVVPAAILVVLQHGLDLHVVGVLATFVVVQFVEGNILTPNIVGESVGLHPVWVILAVLVFGNLFGFVGLLIAVPLAACLKVLVLESVQYYRGSALFTEPDGLDGGTG